MPTHYEGANQPNASVEFNCCLKPAAFFSISLSKLSSISQYSAFASLYGMSIKSKTGSNGDSSGVSNSFGASVFCPLLQSLTSFYLMSVFTGASALGLLLLSSVRAKDTSTSFKVFSLSLSVISQAGPRWSPFSAFPKQSLIRLPLFIARCHQLRQKYMSLLQKSSFW